LIGGVRPAKDYILMAAKSGKHVVTANKELIAKEGRELLEAFSDSGTCFLFEASVGGGIPLLNTIRHFLGANRIKRIMGIINGTTNYILTQMSCSSLSFEEALADAQKRGYAEAEPSNDIDGFDPAFKAVILTLIGFGVLIKPEQVHREGIRRIEAVDIEYCKELGYAIKLLAIVQEREGKFDVRVHPALLPVGHPLASVNGVFNAVFVEGRPVGELMFFGEGAGPYATSSAVVGDVILIAKAVLNQNFSMFYLPQFKEAETLSINELEFPFYMRMIVEDKPGVLAEIARILGEKEVSIASLVQKASRGKEAEIVLITHKAPERNVQAALAQISKLSVVYKVANVIRVAEE